MTNNTTEELKRYRSDMVSHLQMTLNLAQNMAALTLDKEGDSDLHRKLEFYLIPALNHWLVGSQAGNMKDLDDLFTRRAQNKEVSPQPSGKVGDGHEVLTDKK